jgi:hypothetical protein
MTLASNCFAHMPIPLLFILRLAHVLGAQDWSKEERQRLAAKSRTDIPKYGTPERQKLINEMHAKMLAVPSPQVCSGPWMTHHHSLHS